MGEDFSDRKALSFEQAEGLAPIPTQLAPKMLSHELRARLWQVVYNSLVETSVRRNRIAIYDLSFSWRVILQAWNVEVNFKFADEFDTELDIWVAELKKKFKYETYEKVLGFLQFVLRHDACPAGFAKNIASALAGGRAAYRVIDNDTIVPIASEAEGNAVVQAFADLRQSEFGGARNHLQNAATYLTQGQWADSVRESMHSVESVVRLLGRSNSVGDALKKLANAGHINPNMSAGLGKLYNYTSDEKGIRHALLEDGDAKVDEADALYMFGACAAFVTYLIGKGRQAGLLNEA